MFLVRIRLTESNLPRLARRVDCSSTGRIQSRAQTTASNNIIYLKPSQHWSQPACVTKSLSSFPAWKWMKWQVSFSMTFNKDVKSWNSLALACSYTIAQFHAKTKGCQLNSLSSMQNLSFVSKPSLVDFQILLSKTLAPRKDKISLMSNLISSRPAKASIE